MVTVQNKNRSKTISITANLGAKNVDKTLQFYESIGFATLLKFPETGEVEWGLVQKDNTQLMFQNINSLSEEFPELNSNKKGGVLTLWFQVNNIKHWFEEIKDKCKVIRPLGITTYNGATEFVIKDLNGFILHFSDFQF